MKLPVRNPRWNTPINWHSQLPAYTVMNDSNRFIDTLSQVILGKFLQYTWGVAIFMYIALEKTLTRKPVIC